MSGMSLDRTVSSGLTSLNGTATTPSYQVTTVPVGSKLRIYIDRTNANRVYIGLSGFLANRLVTTPDGGTTWAVVSCRARVCSRSNSTRPSPRSCMWAA